MQVNLPQDLKLEVFCLGAIISSINAANEAFSLLDESDFFNPDHKKIFTLMKSSYSDEAGCNLYTMSHKMDKEEGNYSKSYLLYLEGNAWSGMPYDEYFQQVKNLASLRKSCFAAQELLINACLPNASYDEVIGEHQNKLLKTMGINFSTLTANHLYNDYKNNMSFVDYALWKRDRFHRGLPTYEGVRCHFPLLDKTLGSFQNGGLYYIGARTSMGKTTLILNLISNMMKHNRVGIFSLEMDAQMIFEKLLCIFCDIKYSDFSQGNFPDEHLERIKSMEPFLKKDCIFIEDEQSLPLSKLIARAKRMKKTNNIEILFIDYLTLIRSDTKYPTKHMQVDEVSKGLQSLAKVLKIPVVCLAQLNRASIGNEDSRPTLAHFRESGSIEEDADGCILIHRPEYYNKNTKPGQVELIVAKNRIMGTLKTIDYSCDYTISDRYHESLPLEEEMKKARDEVLEKQFDKNMGF